MRRDLLIIGIAIVILGAAGYAGYQLRSTGESEPTVVEQKNIPAPDAKNATYEIDGRDVTLTGGVSSVPAAPGSASMIVTRYFGNDVKADINNDGRQDIVFLLSQETGGSGTFYYVAAVLGTPTGYRGTNAILLGDRIAPQATEFRDGEIIVNYADRAPGESMATQPSIGVSRYFRIHDGRLEEIKS
jgi:hypothetical protein